MILMQTPPVPSADTQHILTHFIINSSTYCVIITQIHDAAMVCIHLSQ